VLKETVSLPRWLILAASFIGVLIVVRPGFRDLSLGHLAALGSAFFGAITTTVLRRVAKEETRVSLIGMATLYIVVVNGTLMLVTGAVRVPTWTELAWLMLIGALGGTGNMLFIAATRAVQASRIAPLQYSQIFWAILFGAPRPGAPAPGPPRRRHAGARHAARRPHCRGLRGDRLLRALSAPPRSRPRPCCHPARRPAPCRDGHRRPARPAPPSRA
jgi:uncharacterized membrane protein